MKTRTVSALLAAAALAVAGCGGSGSDGPIKQLDLADDARAEAIALTVIDFPAGWRGALIELGDGRPDCELDLPHVTLTGEETRGFQLETGTIATSIVSVYRFPADAGLVYKQLTRPDVLRCLASVDEAARDAPKAVRKLPLPTYGDESAAFELAFDLSMGLPDATPTTYVNLVFIRRGRALSSLYLLEDGSRFDASVRRHLARILAERLRLAFT